jgi:hypothetical protein
MSENNKKGWRDVLPVHPAAEIFPLMSEPELKAMAEDIKKNGLQVPIVLCRADDRRPNPYSLVDGRNRLDAMELAGVTFRVFRRPFDKDWDFQILNNNLIEVTDCRDPYEFVISANAHRRHLTPEQKRELIAKVLKARPEISDRQIAAIAKASPTTAGKVRSELEAKGDVSKLDTRKDSKGRKQPASKPGMLTKRIRERARKEREAAAKQDQEASSSEKREWDDLLKAAREAKQEEAKRESEAKALAEEVFGRLLNVIQHSLAEDVLHALRVCESAGVAVFGVLEAAFWNKYPPASEGKDAPAPSGASAAACGGLRVGPTRSANR